MLFNVTIFIKSLRQRTFYMAFFLTILLVNIGQFAFASDVDTPAPWTLQQCLTYGIASHPLVAISQSSVNMSKSNVDQSRSAMNSKVNFRGGWSHKRDEFIRNTTLSSVSQLTADSTSETMSVSKLIIDSGTVAAQVAAARKSVLVAQMDKKARILEIAADIKKAFFKVLRTKELLVIQEETLEGYITHLNKVKGYVEVGTKPAYDITKAKVDVANTQVELIMAKSSLKQAKVALSRAIGISHYIEIVCPEDIQTLHSVELDTSKSIKDAQSRPEIESLKLQIEANKYKIREAKSSLRPSVSASADYNWSGTASPLDRSWNAGVSLNWSVFDGRLSDAKIDNAKWNLKSSKASLDNLKLNILTEVENAITNYNDASERYKATKILVVQAKEAKELAEGRYDAGLGSPIEITDARVGYAQARGNNVIALYDSLIAIAELDRVRGRLPEELKVSKDNNTEIIIK